MAASRRACSKPVMRYVVWYVPPKNCRIANGSFARESKIRAADFNDAATWRMHLTGCDAAYYLVHSMIAAGRDYSDADRQLALKFAQAARAAGVKRIIYLGGLGETGAHLSKHFPPGAKSKNARIYRCPGHGAPRRDDYRFRLRVVRDSALFSGTAAGDGHSQMGEHLVPANWRAKRDYLSGGSVGGEGNHRRRVRYRWP